MRDSAGLPYLWNFIIYLLTHTITDNLEGMKILHLAISTTTAFLILKYSPFNKIIKILIVFSYLLFYEYSIISRPYALGVLLIIIFCVLYKNKIKNIIPLSIVLFFLGQVSIFTFILSFILFIYLLTEILLEKKMKRRNIYFFISLSILLFGLLAIYWQIGSQIFGERVVGSNLNVLLDWKWANYKSYLITTSIEIISAFIQIPEMNLNFWNSNILLNLLPGFRGRYVVLLALFIFGISLLSIKRKYLYLYLLGCTGIIFFTSICIPWCYKALGSFIYIIYCMLMVIKY